MKQLLAAILSTWATNAAAANPPTPAGTLNGIGGPHWDAAPEKPAFPYCVLSQLPAPKIIWGFGGGIYAGYVGIRFAVYASDPTIGGLIAVAGYADAIAAIYDNKRNLGLVSEAVKIARRIGEPVMKKEPIYGPDGVAVYSGTLDYEYSVERTL